MAAKAFCPLLPSASHSYPPDFLLFYRVAQPSSLSQLAELALGSSGHCLSIHAPEQPTSHPRQPTSRNAFCGHLLMLQSERD